MSRKPEQARVALRSVDAGIDRMRGLLRQGATRQGRLSSGVALHELLARQQQLLDLHRRIEASPAHEAEELWEEFFDSYERFLEALDEARLEAVEDELAAEGHRLPALSRGREHGRGRDAGWHR